MGGTGVSVGGGTGVSVGGTGVSVGDGRGVSVGSSSGTIATGVSIGVTTATGSFPPSLPAKKIITSIIIKRTIPPPMNTPLFIPPMAVGWVVALGVGVGVGGTTWGVGLIASSAANNSLALWKRSFGWAARPCC